MIYWVPLLSEKAMLVLGKMLAPHCEFLPWIEEPGHKYTLINVTTRIPRENWSCERSFIIGDTYVSADVISLHNVPIPDLFRLDGYDGKIFVSDAIAQLSVDRGLKGAMFVDPSIPEIHLSFIPKRFGRKGTGFIRCEDDFDDGLLTAT